LTESETTLHVCLEYRHVLHACTMNVSHAVMHGSLNTMRVPYRHLQDSLVIMPVPCMSTMHGAHITMHVPYTVPVPCSDLYLYSIIMSKQLH